MNPGRIPKIMILIGTNNVSRGSDEQEELWESMMVCLFTTLWHKLMCAVLTVCTVTMSTKNVDSDRKKKDIMRESSGGTI